MNSWTYVLTHNCQSFYSSCHHNKRQLFGWWTMICLFHSYWLSCVVDLDGYLVYVDIESFVLLVHTKSHRLRHVIVANPVRTDHLNCNFFSMLTLMIHHPKKIYSLWKIEKWMTKVKNSKDCD